MNRRGKNLSKRLLQMRQAYAPSSYLSKYLQKRKEMRKLRKGPTSMPELAHSVPTEEVPQMPRQTDLQQNLLAIPFQQTENGYACEIPCSQDLAYEIISRELHEHVKALFELSDVHYTGDSFVLEGPSVDNVMAAVNATISRIRELFPEETNKENLQGMGENLPAVPYSVDLEHTGDPICLFCENEFKPEETVHRTPCFHLFHTECMQPWLQTKRVCPIDRIPL